MVIQNVGNCLPVDMAYSFQRVELSWHVLTFVQEVNVFLLWKTEKEM
jgi:hypothetical protein